MDNINDQFTNEIAPPPARPPFLKWLCIISLSVSGLIILVSLAGSMLLGVGEEKAVEIMEQMKSSGNIQMEDTGDPVEMLKELGIMFVMLLGVNIVSLVGVVMMWNLNKIGFFVYAAAEIGANFVGMNMNTNADSSAVGNIISFIIFDLIFIVLFALNLKHMNKKPAIT